MRWTLLLAALALVSVPSTGLAGTPEDPEITDPRGDAGVEDVAAPTGAEDFDIVAAWFTTNETGTWATLELVSFEVHPEDVVFTVDATLSDDRWIGVGYGSYVIPFPPFRTQGFQGCTGTDGQEPNCTSLPGEMLDERPGFTVQIPSSWIDGEPRLREPTAQVAAYAMFPAVAFDEAGPGESYPLETDGTGQTNATSAPSQGPGVSSADDEAPVPGPGVWATGLTVTLAGLGARAAANRPRT